MRFIHLRLGLPTLCTPGGDLLKNWYKINPDNFYHQSMETIEDEQQIVSFDPSLPALGIPTLCTHLIMIPLRISFVSIE